MALENFKDPSVTCETYETYAKTGIKIEPPLN
jgi:hypothetical protein